MEDGASGAGRSSISASIGQATSSYCTLTSAPCTFTRAKFVEDGTAKIGESFDMQSLTALEDTQFE